MDSLPVRFDTSSIADDPEFKRLVAELSLAQTALTSYLNRALELKLTQDKDDGDSTHTETVEQRTVKILMEQLEQLREICKHETLRSAGSDAFVGISNAMACIAEKIDNL